MRLGVLALFLALALLPPALAAGTWIRGETADPGSLDPHKTSTSVEAHILDELYEGLTVYDGHGQLQPGVAARWDVSADGLAYTFHLRPDAQWSNGAPVTADDFVYSFRRLMDPRTGAGYANILYTVRNARGVNTGGMPLEQLGIRAIDLGTLEITLEHPATTFLDQLTHFTAMPVYRPSVERWGDAFARAGRMVGNGAFVLKDYVPGDRLVLVKNPPLPRRGARVARRRGDRADRGPIGGAAPLHGRRDRQLQRGADRPGGLHPLPPRT